TLLAAVYTLSLHAALPICRLTAFAGGPTSAYKNGTPLRGPVLIPVTLRSVEFRSAAMMWPSRPACVWREARPPGAGSKAGCNTRSEEHTSELQLRENLVCS